MPNWNAILQKKGSMKTETRDAQPQRRLPKTETQSPKFSCLALYGVNAGAETAMEDEGKDFLYHIAKSTEAQEYGKRAEGVEGYLAE